MSYYKDNNSNGLTLIEVLISMVILVVGILSVMMMLSTAAKGNAEARKMTRALNIAEDRMDKFLYGGLNCTGNSSLNEYSVILDHSISYKVNGTNYCKVTVNWTSSGKQREISLQTLKKE